MRSTSRPTTPPANSANTGSQYFDRRGEVNELKQALRTGLAERDIEKMKDNIRKVIGYMTLGVDMSRIFSEMVMASQLGDVVQKKMVYLYLTTYAEENTDLAILAVNTLQKDTRDVDPSVRGLALRSLCSLRLLNATEYFEPAIAAGLSDPSGYVRKTAVMCVLKVSEYDSVDGFLAQLESMLLTDSDPSVVSNCIAVLSEKSRLSHLISQSTVYQILSRFSEFTEWGKCLIIKNILSTYYPSSEDELYDLMNVLDVYVKQSSIPVTVGIMKLFISWSSASTTEGMEDQIILRFKDPILTLLSSACNSVEMQYELLVEILKILTKKIEIFSPHWKTFIISGGDTDQIGSVKIDILGTIGLGSIREPIISELLEYMNSFPSLALSAVEAVARIVNSGDPSMRHACIDQLIRGMEESNFQQSSTLTACIIGLSKIIRDDADPMVVPPLVIANAIKQLLHAPPNWTDVTQAIEAAITLISHTADDAIFQLEYIADKIWSSRQDEDEKTNSGDGIMEWSSCQISLIFASVSLFFKRPTLISRKFLTKIFYLAIEESTDPDVRDCALFYYRLIRSSSGGEVMGDVRRHFSRSQFAAVLGPPSVAHEGVAPLVDTAAASVSVTEGNLISF